MMKTYVWLTFAFLGWGYYEASGGADFKPGAANAATDVAAAEAPAPTTVRRQVTAKTQKPAAHGSIHHRVESALLVALRDKPGASESAGVAAVQPIALRAGEGNFAPVKAVVLDTSPKPKPKPQITPQIDAAATAEAPDTSIRPRMRPGTVADAGAPVISTRSSTDAAHEVIVTNANLRMGPGTNFPVLDQLGQGTKVRLLREGEDGWVKLKATDEGRIGWMAGYLIAER